MTIRWRSGIGCMFILTQSFACGADGSGSANDPTPSSCITGEWCGSGGVCRADGTCNLPMEASCTANTECRQGQQGLYCVNGQCIDDPVNADCQQVFPPNALEEVDGPKLLIGFIGDLDFEAGAADNSYGRPPLEGVMHALEEVAASGGMPAITGAPGRHLAVLACTENGPVGANQAARAAQHLVEAARVPAIIGASTSSNTTRAWDFIRTQTTAVLMSPTSTSPSVAALSRRDEFEDPENRLWRISPSDEVQVELLQLLARDVMAAISPPSAELRVYYKDDLYGIGLERALANSGLPDVFNEYVPLPYEEREDDWESPTAYAQRAVAEPLPNLIIALGTDEFVRLVLPEIERLWPMSAVRPWYVLPEGGKHTSLTEYATAHPELELSRRVIGTAPGARKSARYTDFANHFEGRFNHPPGNLAEFGYDATYALAYAVARTNAVSPDGLRLAAALNELACKGVGALTIAPGVDGFAGNFQNAAERSNCIDLDGASGPLDFDVNGETKSDIATWCLRRRPDSTTTFEPPLDVYLNVATGLVEGGILDLTNPGWCPPSP